MEIKKVFIKAFGRLSDREIYFRPGINVFTGPNEAGKSTFLNFVKAMFYGLGDSRKKNLDDRPREKYRPWGAEGFGGAVIFSIRDSDYRLVREFGNTVSSDLVSLFNENSGEKIPLPPNKEPGEYLFNISAREFVNTVFVGQLKTGISDASEIKARLQSMAAGGEEDLSLRNMEECLTEYERKIFSAKRSGSLYPGLEEKLKGLSESFDAAVEANNKILEINEELSALKKKETEIKLRISEIDDFEVYKGKAERLKMLDLLQNKREELSALRRQREELFTKFGKYEGCLTKDMKNFVSDKLFELKNKLAILKSERKQSEELRMKIEGKELSEDDAERMGKIRKLYEKISALECEAEEIKRKKEEERHRIELANEKEKSERIECKSSADELSREIREAENAKALSEKLSNEISKKKAELDEKNKKFSEAEKLKDEGRERLRAYNVQLEENSRKINEAAAEAMRLNLSKKQLDGEQGKKRFALPLVFIAAVIPLVLSFIKPEIQTAFFIISGLLLGLCFAMLLIKLREDKRYRKRSEELRRLLDQCTEKSSAAVAVRSEIESNRTEAFITVQNAANSQKILSDFIEKLKDELSELKNNLDEATKNEKTENELETMREELSEFKRQIAEFENKEAGENASAPEESENEKLFGEALREAEYEAEKLGFLLNGDIFVFKNRLYELISEDDRRILEIERLRENLYDLKLRFGFDEDSANKIKAELSENTGTFMDVSKIESPAEYEREFSFICDGLAEYKNSDTELSAAIAEANELEKRLFNEGISDDEKEKAYEKLLRETESFEGGAGFVKLNDRNKEEIQTAKDKYKEQLKNLSSQITDLKGRLLLLRENSENPAAIENEMKKLNKALSALKAERDAIIMAKDWINSSEKEMQESFGPVINENFSRYLTEMTGKERTELKLGGDFSVKLEDPDTGALRELEFYSSGKRDQVYLALRMAVISAVYGDLKLPVFLDDPFVQYDRERAEAAVKFFSELSEKENIQVIFTSCRDDLAEMLENTSFSLYHF